MKLSEIEYPLRLVVETVSYCFWSNPVTSSLKAGEMKAKLSGIYGPELVEEAIKILSDQGRVHGFPKANSDK